MTTDNELKAVGTYLVYEFSYGLIESTAESILSDIQRITSNIEKLDDGEPEVIKKLFMELFCNALTARVLR